MKTVWLKQVALAGLEWEGAARPLQKYPQLVVSRKHYTVIGNPLGRGQTACPRQGLFWLSAI